MKIALSRFGLDTPVWRQGFPFFVATPRSPIERLRAFGAVRGLDFLGRRKRLLLRLIMCVTWPWTALLEAVKMAGATKFETSGGRVGAFCSLYSAALLRNIPPKQYALYHHLDGVRGDAMEHYLFQIDSRALIALNAMRRAPSADIQDKQKFAAICLARGLPHVETLAAFKNGRSVAPNLLQSSSGSVFVKALSGRAGEGAEIWTRDGEAYVSTEGLRRSATELSDSLSHRDCIIQRRLMDCSALRPFGSGALSTLRIVTARIPNGRVLPVLACLNLASEPDRATNHTGLKYGIDLADGRISKVFSPTESRVLTEAPLEAEGKIIGLVLPGWTEVLALISRAHDEAFSAFVTLGWDVALTDDGPVLLEANQGWGISQHQMLDGPLGQTPLGGVIEEVLDLMTPRAA